MNTNRLSLIALAAASCSFASAQWFPNTTLVGTTAVSTVPAVAFFDLTSVNGVPVLVSTNGTATGYSGPIGTWYNWGTDLSTRTYFKGLSAVGPNTSTSYSQQHAISWDGTKFSTGMLQQALDGSMRAGMAQYNAANDQLTPFGSLGYYSNAVLPQQVSAGYCMSGDGNSIGGQAYWRASQVGTASTATNVIPIVGTVNGAVSLLPSTTNNGRTVAMNFDGTVASGFGVGSADPLIWRKVAGVWGTGVAPIGTNGTNTGISLGTPTAMDGAGRFVAGTYNGLLVPDNRPGYLLDTTTGKVDFFWPTTPPPTYLGWNTLVTDVSAYGDIVYGRFQNNTGTPAINVFRGFVWTPTAGLFLLNDFVDAQWPGVRNPVLDINNFGSYSMAPDGDWATCGTFSNSPTTAAASAVILRLGTPLRGLGTLGDYIGDKKAKNLTFTLKDSGGNTVDTLTGKLDDLGRWVWLSKIDLGSSTWSLEIDGGQFLRKTIAVTQATKNALNFALQNGDPDMSGEVDAADIDMVIAAFGSVVGDPGWNADIDVDGSDEVDAADIDIVIANFGGVDN